VNLNEDAAAEYVLLGASHSDETLAQGISTLPLARVFDLEKRRMLPRFSASIWTDARVPATFEDAVDQAEMLLRAVFKEAVVAFPGRVRMALSGGFDSRLIVAGLLACDMRPELFVYGGAGSEDVPLARAIASSLDIPLEVVDKGVLNKGLAPPDVERLVQNAWFFDGLPSDGIYDPGADQQTRLASTAGGHLALNGGGGEIFRNFFHLPDRPLRAIDIVRTFYRGFDPGVFRRRDGLAAWQDRLVTSMNAVLGTDGVVGQQTLTRDKVELIYPLFRCHHWMGVNNSVATRHGYYATPLVDLNMVRLASSLPLGWKNAGRLQSCLVARLHHGIANQPSTYGFRFSDGPDWHARFTEWTTCRRPVFARPFINATRRRLKKLGVTPDMVTHCRSLLPGEWRLDRVLNLERLPDDFAFARALTVEIVWRELLG
jgi:asparagine synthase (glutamine-hydrolysing)